MRSFASQNIKKLNALRLTFLTKHKNERKAFMDLIKDPTRYQNTIFVFDRGYFSEELFESIQNKGLFFICRMRKNSLLINHDENDAKVKLKNGHNVRIVTYTIDEKDYYMATNLMDNQKHSIATIKSIYNDRWNVEELFKFVKSNLSLNSIEESQEENILKSIYSNVIISLISYLFTMLNEKTEAASKKINKSLLSSGIFEEFLYNFLTGRNFNTATLIKFCKIYIKFVITSESRYYKRICKRCNKFSYFKNGLKNPKSMKL